MNLLFHFVKTNEAQVSFDNTANRPYEVDLNCVIM